LNDEHKGQAMKVVCAWCGKTLGEKDGCGVDGVSHGLCSECLDRLGEKAEKGESELRPPER